MAICLNNKLNECGKPLISFVVTCTGKAPELIRDSVMSIVDLTLSAGEREIIVVDYGVGASPINGLGAVIDEMLYVRIQAKSLPAARNAGLRMASGTHIQFVSGGDVLNMAHYNHCLDIARYKHPDMVMFRIVPPDNIDKGAIFRFFEPVAGTDYMRGDKRGGDVCGYMFRKSLLGGLRFSEKPAASADNGFTREITTRAKRLFPTVACACLRRREQQVSGLEDEHIAVQPHTDANSKTLREKLLRWTSHRR